MIIEFHTQEPAEVNKWLIEDIKKKIAKFQQQDNQISGASVYFNTSTKSVNGDHTCVVVLSASGHSLMVQRSAFSYPVAAGEVLDELSKMMQENIRKQKVA